MPIYSEDGQQYENEALYRLGEPTNESKDLSGNGKKEPLKVTITPHMQAGEFEQGIPEGGLTEPKEVHIVRHGETTENADNTVRGWEPVSLNENGIAEAHKAGKELKEKGVDTIVSSDLQRAKETAAIIQKETGAEVQFDPRLRTWNVGEHAGKPCETSNPILKEYAQNKQDEPVPGGESFNDFKDRSFAGIRDAILNNKDKNLAILTHNRVEATLKGWEKTGQENPDIDYNEVVKEETEPGTVRTVKFQPNATILQQDNTFDERFPKQFDRLPYSNEAPIDKGLTAPGWWRNESVRKDPELDEYPGQHALKNWPKDMNLFQPDKMQLPPSKEGFQKMPFDPEGSNAQDLMYKPISEKLPGLLGPMWDIARQKDIGNSRHTKQEMEDWLNKGLRGSQSLPGREGGPGRGNKTPSRWTDSEIDRFNKMYQEGKSDKEIAEEFGIARGTVRSLVDRFDSKNAELSEWMKNQFEGGPVEGYTRLYRGETDLGPKAKVPDWVAESPEYKAMIDATGRWFNKDYETARYYNQTFGDKSGRVSYVDVPTADLEKHLSANQPAAKKFSAQGRDLEEYFLPKELADKRIKME